MKGCELVKASYDLLIKFKEFETKRQAASKEVEEFCTEKMIEVSKGYTRGEIEKFRMLCDVILLHNGITPNAVFSTIIGSTLTPGFLFIFLQTHLIRFIVIAVLSLLFLIFGLSSMVTGKIVTKKYNKLI
jgi:hypothetical protein